MDCIDIFPDTNIFLHYPSIHAIDWMGLTGKSEVRLVLCLQVIDELDEKKSHPLLSGRAKRAITEIRAAKAERIEIHSGVTVEVFKYDPEDQSSGDRRIVQLVQEYKRQNPDRNVAILTEDGGMEIRCETAGVQVVMMDSSVRLVDVQDELTKKNNLLSAELAAFKTRQPRLSVFATKVGEDSDGRRPPSFEITPTSFHWIDVDAQMESVRKTVPKYNMRAERPAGSTLNPELAKAMEQLSRVGNGDKEQYNRDVDEYLIDYKNYLDCLNVAGAIKAICIELDLVIANDGTAPASDVDVLIEWPEAVLHVAKSGSKDAAVIEKTTKPPSAPKKPESLSGLSLSVFDGPRMPTTPKFSVPDKFAPVTTCRRSGDTWQTSVRIPALQHGHPVRVGKLFVSFCSPEKCKSFSAPCRVSASELLQPLEDKISVIVQLVPQVPAIPAKA